MFDSENLYKAKPESRVRKNRDRIYFPRNSNIFTIKTTISLFSLSLSISITPLLSIFCLFVNRACKFTSKVEKYGEGKRGEKEKRRGKTREKIFSSAKIIYALFYFPFSFLSFFSLSLNFLF